LLPWSECPRGDEVELSWDVSVCDPETDDNLLFSFNMFWSHSSRAVRQQWHLCKAVRRRAAGAPLSPLLASPMARAFHAARPLLAVKPVLLADIGEGRFNSPLQCPAYR
jgi:hypothetical protein